MPPPRDPPSPSAPDRPAPPEEVQATFTATLVDEWVRGGLRHAVICPGSRSTPLALALAGHDGVDLHVHHDERSGSFLALGIGLATGHAAAVVTTSGTAATELHPAVVEAHEAGVPLLVCTADRPTEMRDTGAPQTIDQTHLYGRAVRWYADPGVPDQAASDSWRALASRALAATRGQPPGPVHLNLPFREPLVGAPGPLPPPRPVRDTAGPAPLVQPWSTIAPAGALPPQLRDHLVRRLTGQRGIVMAGGATGPEAGTLAERLGWPVIADPRSGAWTSAATVPWPDAILRSPVARQQLRPEVILRLGEPPASRAVNEWCAATGAEEIVVAGPRWSDPAATAALATRADPAAAARELADAAAALPAGPADPAWHRRWQATVSAAGPALDHALDGLPEVNEPAVARQVVAALPAGAHLVVSSSMPVRDVERYVPPRPGVRLLANRGANGIDGVVSTAVGVAAGTGAPTGLLIGDIAFLHDSNGLLGAAGRSIDLVAVVIDNDGGGIFSFLPQATRLPQDRFEQLFGTPHGLDLVTLARAHGVQARRLTGPQARDVGPAVAGALSAGGVHVLVVPTDRAGNVETHRTLDEAVAGAVDAALAREGGDG